MKAYKYQGAGNDFIIFDNRNGDIILNEEQIRTLCDRRYGIGADGLMLLNSNDCEDRDFKMVFYNSDGAPGTMCGNGARCLVAFAARMGYTSFRFDALDGYHTASMIEYTPFKCIVKLKIKDVEMPVKYSDTLYYKTQCRPFSYFMTILTNMMLTPMADIGDITLIFQTAPM